MSRPGADSSTFIAGKIGEGKPMTVTTNTKTKDEKPKKDTQAIRPLFSGNKPVKKGDIF